MRFAVDIVTGPSAPKYTLEVFRRLPANIDRQLLTARAYGATQRAIAYRLVHHPVQTWSRRRRGAILHVDSQLLGYLFAFPLRSPRVLTCHDLVPFVPEFDDPSYVSRSRPLERAYYTFLARGLRRANRVIAVSEYVRGELLRFGCEASRLDVVHNGVDLDAYRPRERAECTPVLRRYGVPGGRSVVLFVGTEHPRKNLPILLRAFARIARTRSAVLLKVGSARHPQREQLESLAATLGIADRVSFVNRVAEADLPLLYGASDVLVLASSNEGFGLPPLEAMACGTAVVVSHATSLPEVVGDAGVYVDPGSEEELADAIARVLEDGQLREDLRARGRARALNFSWDRTVAGVVRTYERALARSP